MARKMTAKFPGTCRGCSDRIESGERIVHAARRENWHVACYENRNEVAVRIADTGGDAADEAEAANDRRAASAADAEYAAGIADTNNYRFNRDTFGEDYAAAEEFAWGLKTGDGY